MKFSLIFSESVSIIWYRFETRQKYSALQGVHEALFIWPKFQAMPNPISVKRKDVFCSNSKTISDRNVIFGMIVDLYNV